MDVPMTAASLPDAAGVGETDAGSVMSRGTLVIDTEACKGCWLCIDACPPRVLEMTTHTLNSRGYRYPVLLSGCTGCRACSQICPDFVFQVFKYETPVSHPAEEPRHD